MPNSFENDGAFGGGTGGGSAPGTQTGGFQQQDFGGSGNPQPSSPTSDQAIWQADQNYTSHYADPNNNFQPDAGNYSTDPKTGLPSYTPLNSGQSDYYNAMYGDPGHPKAGVYKQSGTNWSFTGFSQGGAIPDSETGEGSPEQDQISKALESVDAVLAFGRKLHGLGGGDNEGAIQTASRMPSVPGTPSDSGAKPVQPMPGPLPPTANPFGKRASATGSDPDQDGDNDSGSAGAIDTDEDAA